MRRLLATMVAAVALTLTGAACSHHHDSTSHAASASSSSTTSSTSSSSLKCPPGDVTMQCVLATQPPPNAGSLPKATASTYGIDFGWSAVSAAGAHSIGARFGASYLSSDASKNWTRAMVDSYHALGLGTVAVWETSADRASTEGGGSDGTFAAGEADARAARAQATALGMPTDRVIEFAVDCDCTVGSLEGYFAGAKAVLGQIHEGVYGGYDQVLGLYDAHLVGSENWQTYAWSGGRWLPSSIAPLEQYLNGSAFDNDRAIAPLYGQWPAKVTPPANPLHYKWLPTTRRTFVVKAYSPVWGAPRTVHANERGAAIYLDAHGCVLDKRSHQFVRQGCVEHAQHARLLGSRLSAIARRSPNLKHPAKSPRWDAVHYQAADGHKTTLGGAERQMRRRYLATSTPTKF